MGTSFYLLNFEEMQQCCKFTPQIGYFKKQNIRFVDVRCRVIQQDPQQRTVPPSKVEPVTEEEVLITSQPELPNHELERLNIKYKLSDAYKELVGGPPRFFSPLIPWIDRKNSHKLPVLIYLPGVDGTCFAGYRQFSRLSQDFDLTCLGVPNSDRTDFQDLIAIVKEYVVLEARNSPVERPIYLCGDSFGSLLAMAVAVECRDIVDRVVLVNPASSFPRTWWKPLIPALGQIPDNIYDYMPYAIIPFFGNIFGLTSHRIDPNADTIQQGQQLIQGMIEQLPELNTLKTLFPADCVLWKAQLVEEGCKHMENVGYRNIQQRTLILTGNDDKVVPSGQEGQRLSKVLPRARVVNVPGKAHTILLESGISLTQIIKDAGFYVQARSLTIDNMQGKRQSNGFGTPGPIELPTEKELQAEMDGKGEATSYTFIKNLTSPVYFSTDSSGRVCEGLEHVPYDKPLMFVGNHQFMGADMNFVVAKLLQERGLLIRGMANPPLFADRSDKEREESGIPQLGDQFATFGAVPNNPRNLYRLLEAGESVMLFPGGVMEGLKRKELAYQLFWPKKAEFVRMAAKFGATIVPFSSIGVDDSYTEILSAEDAGKVPILGDYLRKIANNGEAMDPRQWQGKSIEQPAELVFPVFLPGTVSRYYFKFGAPIETQKEWVQDRQTCEQMYEETQKRVAEGLKYLQEKREQDPYKDLFTRLYYEATQKKQAPTFTP